MGVIKQPIIPLLCLQLNVNEPPQFVIFPKTVEPGLEREWEWYSAQVYARMLRTVVFPVERLCWALLLRWLYGWSFGELDLAMHDNLVGAVVYSLCVAGGNAGPPDTVAV